MIETTTVNGRPAKVAWIGADGGDGGTVTPDEAVLVKVRFTDEAGGIAFLDPKVLPTVKNLRAARAREEAEQTLARLARAERVNETLVRLRRRDFDPNQPRDETGKWTETGASAGGATAKPPPPKKAKKPAKKEDFDKAGVKLHVSDEAKFVETWNEKVGIEPEQFKKDFLGGVDSTMTIEGGSRGKFIVTGNIRDKEKDRDIGQYTRDINLDTKTAESAYFRLNQTAQKSDIGKKVLAGNVAMYQALGIDEVKVHADIDVGGYAWAKYGYVPSPSHWSYLREKLLQKLGGGRTTSSGSGNTVEADDWNMLSTDQQTDVQRRWEERSFEEFYDSEVSNWRDSGRPLEEAKQAASDAMNVGDTMPDWAGEAFDDTKIARQKDGRPPIPFEDYELREAMTLDYSSRYDDGRGDFTVTWDDAILDKIEPLGFDPAQQTLPGIEKPKYSQYLTQEMRDDIEYAIIKKAEEQAESDAEDADPPDYLRDSVTEYMGEYWDQLDDEQRLRYAVDFGLAEIEIEPDEDEELELPAPAPAAEGQDPLRAALNSANPKSIWKVADHPRGKDLLLGTDWSGALNLKDEESLARFWAYVGKSKTKAQANA